MREIGSEFSLLSEEGNKVVTKPDWLIYGDDWEFVFSGRTAFEVVINDITNIRKVLFPSYCCDSMIEPFRKKGVKVEFYSVFWKDGLHINIMIPDDCDVLILCSYFGFKTVYPQEQLRDFQSRGGIIIEDITQGLLSNEPCYAESDYFVASLRKWGALITGGFCSKNNGQFVKKTTKYPGEEFIERKYEAMKLKAEYLCDLDETKKSTFLDLFSQCNKWLAENYSLLKMDEQSKKMLFSWNIDEIRKVRKNNAKVLLEGLKKLEFINPLFDEEDLKCPLFVPVIVKSEKRRDLRNKLIENKIYCPIHWPKPDFNCQSNLYDIELSLVCDQRYNSEDMQNIITVIKNSEE